MDKTDNKSLNLAELTDIKSLNLAELKEDIEALGEKKFRAAQIYDWLHKKLVTSFDEMTNLSAALRERLKERYELVCVHPVDVRTSKLDETKKFLFELNDGNVIESVWMKYNHGNSVCISSQVGCRMGCRFCASTIDGMVRNLRPSEMLEQVYRIQKLTGERVSNIVIMGSGEPLDNFDNLLRFLELISDENGLNISHRNITVSTCGLVDKIYELADKKLQITLALSLHASNDETRRTLMPIANKYTIKEELDACDYYYRMTGRRISFEYSLVSGVNDSEEIAYELAGLLKGRNCHVNLIPVNPVKERKFMRTNYDKIMKFKNILEKCSINATIRRELGMDIDGACGQLRRSYHESASNK
ncbi:MAG: 23S rRNA (adenine(2503)-C(2))-methyltransferase RlmN [Lachnospiraceae bacterium]|nr:23S rRNA (adenine(2503)-C(2))-methyltransferase RlmN [Lachnospiraceae bacterium]